MDNLNTNCYYSNVLLYGAQAKICPIVAPTPSFVTPVILQRSTPHAFAQPRIERNIPNKCSTGYETDIQCDGVYTQNNPASVSAFLPKIV